MSPVEDRSAAPGLVPATEFCTSSKVRSGARAPSGIPAHPFPLSLVATRMNIQRPRTRRPRPFPKGRQIDAEALEEVTTLMAGRAPRRDLLIEHLHVLQEAFGHLSARHLRALAAWMRLSQAEVYEV